MTKGTCVNEKDVSKVVAEDHYVSRYSWVAFGGPVKVELDEVTCGGAKRRGCLEGGEKKREEVGEELGRLLVLKDQKFCGIADQIFSSPVLKVDSFQNVEATLVPTVVPREGIIPEKPSISLLPYLPKNEAWKKLPYTM